MTLRFRAGLRATFTFASLFIVARAGAQDSTAARSLPPVEIHGFLQTYYRSGDPTIKDGFRLRKVDLKFSGALSPHLRWRIGFDAAKALTLTKTLVDVQDSLVLTDAAIDQRSRMLQDAALTYAFDKRLSLDVGQQIVPLSLEGTISTSAVETIERTMFIIERSRAVGLGDVREIGVSANGLALRTIEYHVGVFNEMGEAAGTVDVNDQKAIMSRVAIHPNPNFQFGGSGGFQGGPLLAHKERAAGEIQFRNAMVTLRSEAMSARDGPLRRFGWYALTAVRPTTRFQLVARYDDWDRDIHGESSIANATERAFVIGGSYVFDGSAKIAVNLIRQTFPFITLPRDATIVLAAFQAFW